MINRLSNPINHNRSAAKISEVMSSTLTPSTTPGSPPICPPALKSTFPHHPCTSDKMILSDVFAWYSLMLCHSIEGSKPGCHVNLYNSSDGYSCYQLQFFGNYDFHSLTLPAAIWYWKSGIWKSVSSLSFYLVHIWKVVFYIFTSNIWHQERWCFFLRRLIIF